MYQGPSCWCYRYILPSQAHLFRPASPPQPCKEPCSLNFYQLLPHIIIFHRIEWISCTGERFPSKHFHRTLLCRPVNADTVFGRGPQRGFDAWHQPLLLVGLPIAGELHTTMLGRMWRQTDRLLESMPFRVLEIPLTLAHGSDSPGKEG